MCKEHSHFHMKYKVKLTSLSIFCAARYSLSHDHMGATDIHINFWNHMKFSHLKIMQVFFFSFM